jgi:micrococcal nuclease
MPPHPDRPLWLPAAMLAAFVSGAGLAAIALPPDVEAAVGGPVGPAGKVTKIVDGDTLEFKTVDGKDMTIRLAQIDAPELNQPWGEQARAALARLVAVGEVKLRLGGIDPQGRTMATVRAGEINVNSEMVREGLAWTNPHYVVDPRLSVLEQAARNGKAGLWSAPPGQIVEPEMWRVLHPIPRAKTGLETGKAARTMAKSARRQPPPEPTSAEEDVEAPAEEES